MESGEFLGVKTGIEVRWEAEQKGISFFPLCLKGAAELRVTLREVFMCSECKAVIACGFKYGIEIKCEQASNTLIQLENQGLTMHFVIMLSYALN